MFNGRFNFELLEINEGGDFDNDDVLFNKKLFFFAVVWNWFGLSLICWE